MSEGGDMAFRSIFDKNFKYRNASSTDVRQTFERVRRELRLQEQRAQGSCDDRSANVVATIGRSRQPAAK